MAFADATPGFHAKIIPRDISPPNELVNFTEYTTLQNYYSMHGKCMVLKFCQGQQKWEEEESLQRCGNEYYFTLQFN